MKRFWKELFGVAAIGFIAHELDKATEKADDLEEERDELQSKLDALKEKYGEDFLEDNDEE